jgi:hypothetical protein
MINPVLTRSLTFHQRGDYFILDLEVTIGVPTLEHQLLNAPGLWKAFVSWKVYLMPGAKRTDLLVIILAFPQYRYELPSHDVLLPSPSAFASIFHDVFNVNRSKMFLVGGCHRGRSVMNYPYL